jgi:hypothetical protein
MTDKDDRSDYSDEERPDLMAVHITVTRETMPTLLGSFDLDVGDRPMVEPKPDGSGSLLAFADDEMIRRLEAAGYDVEVGENVSEVGRQRQEEVGTGDRFEGGRVVPRGLGTKPGRNDTGAAT